MENFKVCYLISVEGTGRKLGILTDNEMTIEDVLCALVESVSSVVPGNQDKDKGGLKIKISRLKYDKLTKACILKALKRARFIDAKEYIKLHKSS